MLAWEFGFIQAGDTQGLCLGSFLFCGQVNYQLLNSSLSQNMSINCNAEITDALVATHAFVDVLRAEQLFNWADRFERIATSLEAGQISEAIHSFRNTTYTGPGSLSDIFATDEKAFNSAWGECSSALRRLTHSRTS